MYVSLLHNSFLGVQQTIRKLLAAKMLQIAMESFLIKVNLVQKLASRIRIYLLTLFFTSTDGEGFTQCKNPTKSHPKWRELHYWWMAVWLCHRSCQVGKINKIRIKHENASRFVWFFFNPFIFEPWLLRFQKFFNPFSFIAKPLFIKALFHGAF